VYVEVTESMPVVVIWQRGKKQVSTKKRLLNESTPLATFDEKFQITTAVECNSEGIAKPKFVSVVSCFIHNRVLVLTYCGQ